MMPRQQLIKAGFGLLFILLFSLPLIRLWPHAPLRDQFPHASAVFASDGSLLRLTTAADQQYRYWLPLEQTGELMQEAMLMQEDQWFWQHPGVNPFSLIRGALRTYSGGNRQGGSTITMQLARLLQRESTRTPLAKLQQIGQALWLEARYSKREILEAYLNFAPYGGNIQGVGAASWLYFNKPVAQLSALEAATLAVVPQQPARRPRAAEDTRAAVERLLLRWREQQPQRLGLNASVAAISYRPAAPFRAPHATDLLLQQQRQGKLGITRGAIHSSINPVLQRTLERQIRLGYPQLQARGVENASAMLVHWPSREIVAMVGSADYFDANIAGQVNGSQAKRSPGSTLKPLLFALALEQGMIHPRSMLKDAPQAFGPYTPENYDRRFAGPINATAALNRSRNIPAVALASMMPPGHDLHDLLKRAGVSRLQSREHYGLALVLGAGEVTMQELARLYSALANNGLDAPLTLQHNTSEQPRALLSPQASWLALEMLAQKPRPGVSSQARPHPWFTAWKTGTSWSFRDAWTAGVVGPYVLVVWNGNFDGSANPALVGIKTAAPLWWRIAEALPNVVGKQPEHSQRQRPQPAGVRKVEICAASGDLPNSACPQRLQSWFIPGVSPIRVSDLHRWVWVDKDTGQAVCPPYTAQHEQRLYEFWSTEMAQLFARAGLARRKPPEADCSQDMRISESNGPRIRSPYEGMRFMLDAEGTGVSAQLPLQADAAAGVKRLYWLIENRLLGHSRPGEILYWTPKQSGRYQLTVSDDHGRSRSRWIEVGRLH